MGILEKLGLTQRKARPVGQELETGGRSDQHTTARNRMLLRAGLFLLLVVLTVAAFPKGDVYEYTVQVGDTWRQPTLTAPFNFPIYKDADRVSAEREEARRTTPPYFEELPNPQQAMRANRDTLQKQLDRVVQAYTSFRYHNLRGEDQKAREDSLRFLEMRRNAMTVLSPEQWQLLVTNYVRQDPNLSQTTRSPSPDASGPRLDERLLRSAFELGTQLLNIGVLNRSRDSVQTDRIIIRNEAERVQQSVSKDNVYGLNEAYNYAREQFREQFSDNPEYAEIAAAFFRDIFQPSLRYMRAETMQERQLRARKVSPIRGGVEKGEIIVSKGERITEEIKHKLTSLERVKNERVATRILWKQATGEAIFAFLGFAFFFGYLFLLRRDLWDENREMILISLVMGFIVALFGICVRIPWAQLYAVPVALASVLLTIIYNSRLGLFGTLVLAFIGGQMLGLDLEYTLATFFAGACGVFSVRDVKNRGQFILSAGVVFAGYAAILTASWLYLGTPVGRYGSTMMYAAIGSSFTITSYMFLYALEKLFDVTTDLTLLELSDTNNKLLKKLSLRAPGSFNHSLQVANLAEAAADRIGANALLTRVGALYHDIGKMQKPEYFVENQRAGNNPHDRLKPRMSALIIASHVKEGVEMAKEENLPERVMKFIPTHHGTARIEYFYRKAVGETDEDDSPVLESEFRYPGPRPDSKETGIMMLADSIEAASRSLDDPSHKRLKSLIDLIVKERIEDGQLDDTDLTFRDLSQIKDTFLQMLTGIYHVRVKYPDQEEEEPEETEEQPAVALGMDPENEGVSVLWERDVWGTPEQSVSAERLRRMPGVRVPRAPRPEIAEASQYYRIEGGNGTDAVPPVPEGGPKTSDVPLKETLSGEHRDEEEEKGEGEEVSGNKET